MEPICKVFKDSVAKEDFLEGKNGASKLTKEQIDAINEFSRSVNTAASGTDFDKTAELWNCLVEGRKQKVGNSSSTFKEAMEALELSMACGYLDKFKDGEKDEKPEAKEGGKSKKDRRKDKEQAKNKQQQVNFILFKSYMHAELN